MVVGITTTGAITTKVVGSNSVHGEVYSIKHYMIKFELLASSRWVSPGNPVSPTNTNLPPRYN